MLGFGNNIISDSNYELKHVLDRPRLIFMECKICRQSSVWLLLTMLFVPSIRIQANTLIDSARKNGAIAAETALLYEVYNALNVDSLPNEFREVDVSAKGCGTPLVLRAIEAQKNYSSEYRPLLAKALARPSLSHKVTSPSGRFLLHYEIEGINAVDPLDENGNNLPDYIDIAATIIDSMWTLGIETLNYNPPPSDGGLGGSDQYDIYFEQLGGGYYGFTHPDGDGPTTSTYVRIDNNFSESTYGRLSNCTDVRSTRELTALRVTLAHEFFHMIQFGYYYNGREGVWWQESSATWMEDVAYPEADDYLQYLCDFLLAHNRSLDSNSFSNRRVYGSSVFSHFLDQRYGRNVVREIWEEHSRRANMLMENFDRVLRQKTSDGLDGAINEFAVWNYFTGSRHREEFYEEGHKYPTIPIDRLNVTNDAAVETIGIVDHLASAYIAIEPQLRTGMLTITTELERSRWRRRLALVSTNGVEVRELDNDPTVQILDWDLYEEVVLVITNTDIVGIGYDYAVSTLYTNENVPPRFALRQNFPNPFRPEIHPITRIQYDLEKASYSTILSVFSLDGNLVRVLDLKGQSPRTHTTEWDGKNEVGELVSSGLYYYVLDADGRKHAGKMAVVREGYPIRLNR